uniref:EF-hand domain-containing protein n=1 Tax=Canis lupus familiaris TaxID=9615 RepID=A0A8C0Q1I1_CANLF
MADDKEREGTGLERKQQLGAGQMERALFSVVSPDRARVSQSNWIHSGEVEEEEPTGYIRFEKFLPVMTKVLLEKRYRPIPEDILLRAFEVLDPSKRGFLTKEELIKYMTEEGEPFSQEEMEEMLSAAIDPESNSIRYKDYIAMMVVDDG